MFERFKETFCWRIYDLPTNLRFAGLSRSEEIQVLETLATCRVPYQALSLFRERGRALPSTLLEPALFGREFKLGQLRKKNSETVFKKKKTANKTQETRAHFLLKTAVGSSELFPCVSAAVCSSDQVLYHQAHINDRQAVASRKSGLLTHIFSDKYINNRHISYST